jgi:uncharacterized damage-inducible protein DinB
MTSLPYSQIVHYKQWADRGLYDVVAQNLQRVGAQDAAILLRILDHIYVVDKVFQHHLLDLPHAFRAPRSDEVPDFQTLASKAKEVDDWYASYVGSLPEHEFDQRIDFVFTNGSPAHMTRGEVILHVGLHGTYHRGNAGIVLHKNGISPNDDRMTDFLEAAREYGPDIGASLRADAWRDSVQHTGARDDAS